MAKGFSFQRTIDEAQQNTWPVDQRSAMTSISSVYLKTVERQYLAALRGMTNSFRTSKYRHCTALVDG